VYWITASCCVAQIVKFFIFAGILTWGIRMQKNWEEYNEHLVRRGGILFSIDFLENWNEEIEKMNEGKRGRPYDYHRALQAEI